jgi:hypothetical protein
MELLRQENYLHNRKRIQYHPSKLPVKSPMVANQSVQNTQKKQIKRFKSMCFNKDQLQCGTSNGGRDRRGSFLENSQAESTLGDANSRQPRTHLSKLEQINQLISHNQQLVNSQLNI